VRNHRTEEDDVAERRWRFRFFPISIRTLPFVIIMNSSARCVCVAWLRTPSFTDDQCDSNR
jgi:hypothetical protein